MRARDLLRWIAASPIALYRAIVSPLLPASCIYTPTCSAYAYEAILRHGLLRGSLLAASRLGRCIGALYQGGEDAVPEVFSFAAISERYRRFRRKKGKRDTDETPGANEVSG